MVKSEMISVRGIALIKPEKIKKAGTNPAFQEILKIF